MIALRNGAAEKGQWRIDFKEGSLYPALQRLETQRAIEGRWQDSDRGSAARRVYRLTDDGPQALARKRSEWNSFGTPSRCSWWGGGIS